MPPAKKRRRTAATTKTTSLVPAPQNSIQAFGRISKVDILPRYDVKKEQTDDVVSIAEHTEQQTAGFTNYKKRKFITVQEVELVDQPCTAAICPSSYIETRPDVRASPSPDSNVSTKERSAKAAHPSLTETPTKGARACLETITLASSSAATKDSVSLIKPTHSPSTSPDSANGNDLIHYSSNVLPEELLDLINLHSSFLTALSLHYAHHGFLTPADLRLLTPSIERSWGKRKVRVEDIRRIIRLLSKSPPFQKEGSRSNSASTLRLSDYGIGKICVEVTGVSPKCGFMPRPIDQKALNRNFVRNLKLSWETWNIDSNQTARIYDFIDKLPLAAITTCSSLRKISPLLAKGQRRLEDLKAGAIKPTKETLNPLATFFVDKCAKAPGNRKHSLLERIKAKELHQSALPAPPSQATLDRRSALQRLDEVVPVLNIMTNSGDKLTGTTVTDQKVSFTLPTLVQSLQNSLRNPISKSESENCIRLLAEDVAPEWVGLLKMGKVAGVVVHRAAQPGNLEMKRRLAACLSE
ncbi:MAG: hypothetical protein M1830_000016 [Pleopsidium flavum]|nr:MAG: hypothetical protein M1830_000016 [Pleopsidium flavum]